MGLGYQAKGSQSVVAFINLCVVTIMAEEQKNSQRANSINAR
jgi:hypothetical protein